MNVNKQCRLKLKKADARRATRLKDRARKTPANRESVNTKIAQIEAAASIRKAYLEYVTLHGRARSLDETYCRERRAQQARRRLEVADFRRRARFVTAIDIVNALDKADRRRLREISRREGALRVATEHRRQLEGTALIPWSVLTKPEVRSLTTPHISPKAPLPPTSLLEKIMEIAFASIVDSDKLHNRLQRKLEKLHFKRVLRQFEDDPKALANYTKELSKARGDFAARQRARLTTEQKQQLKARIVELRTDLPPAVDPREVYRAVQRDRRYSIVMTRFAPDAAERKEFALGAWSREEHRKYDYELPLNGGQPQPTDAEARRESLRGAVIGVREAWRDFLAERGDEWKRALNREPDDAWVRCVAEHGVKWQPRDWQNSAPSKYRRNAQDRIRLVELISRLAKLKPVIAIARARRRKLRRVVRVLKRNTRKETSDAKLARAA